MARVKRKYFKGFCFFSQWLTDGLLILVQEARTERDIFAYEIRRLQKMVRTVRADYAKVTRETHEVQDLDDKIRLLEARNTAIKGPITVSSFTSLRAPFRAVSLSKCNSLIIV